MSLKGCFRCGSTWYDPTGVATACICTGMADEQAQYIKSLHKHVLELRALGRRIIENRFDLALSQEDLEELGYYSVLPDTNK
jgi:hypothetical protein